MHINKIYPVITAGLMVFIAAALYLFIPPYIIARDLQTLCAISQDSLANIQVDPVSGIVQYSERIENELLSNKVKSVLQALKVSAEKDKRSLLQKGLIELGQPHWTCKEFMAINMRE